MQPSWRDGWGEGTPAQLDLQVDNCSKNHSAGAPGRLTFVSGLPSWLLGVVFICEQVSGW